MEWKGKMENMKQSNSNNEKSKWKKIKKGKW